MGTLKKHLNEKFNETMEKTVYSCERKKKKSHMVNNDRGSGFYLKAELSSGYVGCRQWKIDFRQVTNTFSCTDLRVWFPRLIASDMA